MEVKEFDQLGPRIKVLIYYLASPVDAFPLNTTLSTGNQSSRRNTSFVGEIFCGWRTKHKVGGEIASL